MAGFLRKKPKKDAAQPASSRFSAPDDPTRVVVSGPMSLSPVRKDSASTRSLRQSQQPRRRPVNPPPSSYEPPDDGPTVTDALPAQQALAPVSRPAVGDPYVAYRRSLRAPPPAQPESGLIPVDGPPQLPRAPHLELNSANPALVADEEDHRSHLIDLPPEIALYQEFGDKLFTNTPPDSLNSKSTGQPQPQQQRHASSTSTPISSPSSLPPISHPPFTPNALPSPDNDMGINISAQHGNLSSMKMSLQSSTLPPNNSFPPSPQHHTIHNEKHTQSPPKSPPRRAPTSPPAPIAHIPRSSIMPVSPPKTPSKRQKALPQVPPEAQTPSMSASSMSRRHRSFKAPVGQPATNIVPVPHPELVNNSYSGPNKPRIFAAQEAMNGHHHQQYPMNAKVNGYHGDDNRDSDAFRMSQLPEIPHEFEMQNGYPSPPSEHNTHPQVLPNTPNMSHRTSLTQQPPNSPPSGLGKPRSGSSKTNRTSHSSSSVVSPPPSSSSTAFKHSSSFTPSASVSEEHPLPPVPSASFHNQEQNHQNYTTSPALSRPASVSVTQPDIPLLQPALNEQPAPTSLQSSTPPPIPDYHRPFSGVQREREFPSPVISEYNTTQNELKDLQSGIRDEEEDHTAMKDVGLDGDASVVMNGDLSNRNSRPLTPTSPPKSKPNGDTGKPNRSSKPLIDPDALQSFSASLGDQIQENGKAGKKEKTLKDRGRKDEVEKGEKRREKGKSKRRTEKEKLSLLEPSKENGGSAERILPLLPSAERVRPLSSSSHSNRGSTYATGEKGHGVEGEKERGYPPTPRSATANSDDRESRSRSLVYSQLISSPPSSLVLDIIAKAAEKEQFRLTDVNGPYMLTDFIADPEFLQMLLEYLNFFEWSLLASVSRTIRVVMVQKRDLREEILERFLRPVGYQRWSWEESPEPLSLSLQDLSDYMRGVSTPTHEYARISGLYVQSLSIHPNNRDPDVLDTVPALTASARAYTRVVLRLRAQAEKEQAVFNASVRKNATTSSPPSASRMSSRAPSPTFSAFSHSHSQNRTPESSLHHQQQQSSQGITFRSPLFRMRRAPLLRVFVPSPEGDWLSDKSVLECEAECRRAGVTHLLRMGDVVWDIAVGDEGNVGRLVWDGSYLIDLDYTYSPMGELPKYMHALAFPPSYFHRVIRSGAMGSNPIVHIDVSPWGEEIAANLQLLQDRVRTETPQGAYHNVVRWVHRSSFVIRPPSRRSSVKTSNSHSNSNKAAAVGSIPITGADNLFVDPGWYGSIVVEAEGTNEALADLQDRCGPGAFPPRVRGAHAAVSQAQVENRKVFRILRERSRPGEIWIKCVSVKERLL